MKRLILFLLLLLSSCQAKKSDHAYVVQQQVPPTPKATAPKSVVATPITASPLPHKKEGFLICLDPGHGGHDSGTRRKKLPILCEKQLSLDLSIALEKQLLLRGYTVVLTRRTDTFIPLPDRVLFAQKKKAILFVSIHFNWAKNGECRGTEVYFFDKKNDLRSTLSKRAAEMILNNMLLLHSLPSRGVKHGNFYVLRENSIPAVLIEAGFFSNLLDAQMLKQKAYRYKLAKAIAQGIDEFCKSS